MFVRDMVTLLGPAVAALLMGSLLGLLTFTALIRRGEAGAPDWQRIPVLDGN